MQAGEPAIEMHRSLRAAGAGAAVVGGKHDDGIVEFAKLFEMSNQATDILVRAVEHGCVRLHVPHEQALLILRHVGPCGNVGITLGQARAGEQMGCVV